MAKPAWKKLIEMSDIELSRLQSNRTELEKIFKSARRAYAQRRAQFDREGIWSPAMDVYENIRSGVEGEPSVKREFPDIEKMSPQRLFHEVTALKKFFMSRTSTVSGAIQVGRETVNRIFGEGTSVEPTQDQMRELWRVFEAWNTTSYQMEHPNYGSNRLQVIIGNLVVGQAPKEFSDFNDLGLAEKLEYVQQYYQRVEDGEFDDPLLRTIGRRF